jgi:hypothetical protein
MRLPPRPLGVLAAVFAVAAIAPAAGAATPSWQFAPAVAPSPDGAGPGSSQAVPLGKVGEISFWSPNRGLLIEEGSPGTKNCTITSATALVPCGLYAYNGESWHLLSEVCGAEDGRIAWAGPDEFWTISDQRPGQSTGNKTLETHNVSLCHFLDGQVVGSYATPLGLPSSYKRMNAAACLSASNCWFGGEPGESPNKGAFHLHWNGQSLTTVYAPTVHPVFTMALADQSTLFESVQVGPVAEEEYGSEDPNHPAMLHQIDPPGSTSDFHPVFMADGSCKPETPCPPLPSFEPVEPPSVGGFKLSSDYTPSAPASNPAPQLWAVSPGRRTREGPAYPVVLRYARPLLSKGEREWTQFGAIGQAGSIDGKLASVEQQLGGNIEGVAAEPGEPGSSGTAAWVTIGSGDEEAHVDRLQPEGEGNGKNGEGKISNEEMLGSKLGSKQGPGKLGSAGPIACPARNDCWMATSQGWLFHLTEDEQAPARTDGYPVDTDPNFASVIAFRPPDEGIPQLPSIEPPTDDSLANQVEPPPPTTNVQSSTTRTSKPLVTNVSSHVVHRFTLELSFKLTVKARVQLLASRKSRRVAQTARKTLRAGRHTLTLRLNPQRWPNKLDLKATPLEPLPTVEAKGVTGQSVPPPVSSNNVST